MRWRITVAIAALLLAAIPLAALPVFAKPSKTVLSCSKLGTHHHHRSRHHRRCTTTRRESLPTATNGPCGGEAVPAKPGGGRWTCSFDDEFDASTADGNSLNRHLWAPQLTSASGFYTGPLGSQACYVDSPNNVSVSGGALHLTVRREPRLFLCGLIPTVYTAGMVSTIYSFSQTYGRFEIRALLPQTTLPGLQETLWLWPVNDMRYGSWPASGEIDLSEFYSQYAATDVPVVHYNLNQSTVDPATNTNVATKQCPIKLSQYNDYALTWEPGTLTVTINGNTCLTDHYQASNVAAPAPFDQPFFIVLTQALGVQANTFNPMRTPLPATTSVDYVRAWK